MGIECDWICQPTLIFHICYCIFFKVSMIDNHCVLCLHFCCDSVVCSFDFFKYIPFRVIMLLNKSGAADISWYIDLILSLHFVSSTMLTSNISVNFNITNAKFSYEQHNDREIGWYQKSLWLIDEFNKLLATSLRIFTFPLITI